MPDFYKIHHCPHCVLCENMFDNHIYLPDSDTNKVFLSEPWLIFVFKADFHLKKFIRNSKIRPFSIVVFCAKLKKVEIFSTFSAENCSKPIKLLECKISRKIISQSKSGLQ